MINHVFITFSAVQIYDLPYIHLIHFMFYQQLANFVSDLGGSLGLWIGMSVLSFAEVFELLLLIGYALLRKLRTRLSGRIRSSSIPGRGTWLVGNEKNAFDAQTSSYISRGFVLCTVHSKLWEKDLKLFKRKTLILRTAKSTEWYFLVRYSLILTFSHVTVFKSLSLGKRFIWSCLLYTHAQQAHFKLCLHSRPQTLRFLAVRHAQKSSGVVNGPILYIANGVHHRQLKHLGV